MHPGTSQERYAGFRNPIDQMTAPTPSTNPEASNESGACRATQITVAAARGRKSRPILNPVTKLNVTSTDKSIKTEVGGPTDSAFKITVTPTESGRPINSVLKIEPDFPKDPAKTYYANLRVDARAKPTAEKPGETKPEGEKPTETRPATEKPSETKSSAN